MEEHIENFNRMSKNDDSTKLLASSYGYELMETMQCASMNVIGRAMIADLEGQYTERCCILTDVLWITNEDSNPKVDVQIILVNGNYNFLVCYLGSKIPFRFFLYRVHIQPKGGISRWCYF